MLAVETVTLRKGYFEPLPCTLLLRVSHPDSDREIARFELRQFRPLLMICIPEQVFLRLT